MRNFHDRALVEIVQQAMQVPEWQKALGVVLVAIRRGLYPRWLVEFVVQKARGEFDSFDAYALGSILARHRRGELAFQRILVGEEPCADQEREENQRLLHNLPAPFEAIVSPNIDNDGYFIWPNNSVALEIGTTASSRTLIHLEFEDGVARWPYFSKEVILAKRTDKWVHWSKGLL